MRKILAFILIIVFVIPLVTAALVLVPVRTWVLDRNFYSRALSGEQLSNILQQSPGFPLKFNLPIQLSQDTLDSLYGVIKQAFTPQYMDSQVQPVVDSILNLVEGKANNLNLSLDIKPIKAAILGEKRDEILSIFALGIPECPFGQTSQTGAQVCRPAGISSQSFTQTTLDPALNQVVQSLPDEYAVKTGDNVALNRYYFWQSTFPGLNVPVVFTILVVLVCLLALLFWIISGLVADSAWGSRLVWMGAALLVPALLVLVLAALLQWVNAASLFNLGLLRFGQVDLTPEVRTAFSGFFKTVATSVARPFFLSGGIALGLAVMLMAWGSLTKPRKMEAEEEAEVEGEEEAEAEAEPEDEVEDEVDDEIVEAVKPRKIKNK
jgi:hypothetical protein